MPDVLPAWIILPFGAPPPPGTAPYLCPPPRGVLHHLAAVVRGRLEGASEIPDADAIRRRVERAAWSLRVAGVGLLSEPIGILEWLDLCADEDEPADAPWHTYGPGESVPLDARTRDVGRALGVIRGRLEAAIEEAPEACRTAALEGAWIVAECLGIRALLGPIGRDEVERMRDQAAHARRRPSVG